MGVAAGQMGLELEACTASPGLFIKYIMVVPILDIKS